MIKKICNYLKKHPTYSAFVYLITGAGVGVLITYPFVQTHPLRWGGTLVVLGVVGLIYPLFSEK
ncbi:MAG: hypothetical protein M1524_02655 [Patescibacteria group bacterium]|nr:hypothetical protein [Patescibacteria group bacterium]